MERSASESASSPDSDKETGKTRSRKGSVERWFRHLFNKTSRDGKKSLPKTPTKNLDALRRPRFQADTMKVPRSPDSPRGKDKQNKWNTQSAQALSHNVKRASYSTASTSPASSPTGKASIVRKRRGRKKRIGSVKLDPELVKQMLGESGENPLLTIQTQAPTSPRGKRMPIFAPSQKRESSEPKLGEGTQQSDRHSILGSNTPESQMSSYVARFVLERFTRNLSLPTEGECQTFKDTAVMIADVSGFTRMNESFAEVGEGGAEKVTKHLNQYFSKLLHIIDKHGGDCVKFAGDALIVIFKEDQPYKLQTYVDAKNSQQLLSKSEYTAIRATQAAIELSNEPAYVVGNVTLTLHTAVGFSDIYAMHLGGNDGQWEFLVAGDAFRQLSPAVDASKRGDVVATKEVWEKIKAHCRGSPVGYGKDGMFKILDIVHPVEILKNSEIKLKPMIAPVISHYVPIPVKLKLQDGVGDKWLCELRQATSVFINLKGLALNRKGCDSHFVIRRADSALQCMQQIIQKNQGYLRQFCVDDKGTVLIVVFGVPPHTWENNPYRAVKTAMEIRDGLRKLHIEHGIGIATGDVYVGSVGSPIRHEHAVVGDTVNASARLSNKVESYEIWVDQRTEMKARHRVKFEFVKKIKVKGKMKEIQVFRPTGFNRLAALEGKTALLGRQNELNSFMMAVLDAKKGKSTAFWITGDVGMGKSTLVSKFYQLARAHFRSFYVAGDGATKSDPYYVIKKLLLDVLELEGKDRKEREKIVVDIIEESRYARKLLPYGFLLNSVLGLNIECRLRKIKKNKLARFFGDVPEAQSSALDTNTFNAQTMKDMDKDGKKLESLVSCLIEESRIKHGRGCVWILEDVNWYDTPSWKLLTNIRKKLMEESIIVITSRSEGSKKKSKNSGAEDDTESDKRYLSMTKDLEEFKRKGGVHMHLEGFKDSKNTYALLCQRLGCINVEKKILDFVHKYSKGNPFLCAEVCRTLEAKQALRFDHDEKNRRKGLCRLAQGVNLSQIKLPSEVRNLLSMRLDHLPATELLVCKLASVFGVKFDYGALFHVFNLEGGGPLNFGIILKNLMEKGIFMDMRGQWYRFSSPMLQEACSRTMSQELRASIHHNIANYYDTIRTADKEEHAIIGKGSDGALRTPSQQVGWHCLRAALLSDSCQILIAENALKYLAQLWNACVDSNDTQNQILNDGCSIVKRYPLAYAPVRLTKDAKARAFYALLENRLGSGQNSEDGKRGDAQVQTRQRSSARTNPVEETSLKTQNEGSNTSITETKSTVPNTPQPERWSHSSLLTAHAPNHTPEYTLNWEKGEVTWERGKVEVSHRYHRTRTNDDEYRPCSQIHIPPRSYYMLDEHPLHPPTTRRSTAF